LEARPFFFINFKGTPSQEEHKTIFSGLIRWLYLVKVTLRRSVQQSAMLSVALTLTFRSLSIPESQFYETWQRKAILWGKGYRGLSIPKWIKFR
jgi:hypothetical protein